MPEICAAATVMEYKRGIWWTPDSERSQRSRSTTESTTDSTTESNTDSTVEWWEMRTMRVEEWTDKRGWNQVDIKEKWVKWNKDWTYLLEQKKFDRNGWWTADGKVWWLVSFIWDAGSDIHEVWTKFGQNTIEHVTQDGYMGWSLKRKRQRLQ
jgi:hypothetical protein